MKNVLKIKNPETGEFEPIASISGADGAPGANGQGVPTGGTAGQILRKTGSGDYETEWNDKAGDSEKLGGVAAELYARKSNVPAYNLLDNSDFRNPVNQRGQSSYTGSKYGIDRWRTWNGSATITLTSNGIKGDGTEASVLYQNIEPNKIVAGKSYTTAAGYSDGSVSCESGIVSADTSAGIWSSTEQVFLSYNNGVPFIRLWHATKTIAWVALYEGSYTADTLPAYVPKGYAAELAECQRYYYEVPSSYMFTVCGYCATDTSARLTIPTPVPMRVNPSVTIDDISAVRILTANGAFVPTAISFGARDSNGIAIFMESSGMTPWTCCTARFATNVSLSADL